MLAQYVEEASPWQRDSLLETEKALLRTHDHLWAAVATSLFLDPKEAYQEIVDWTDDWKQRERIEAVVLFRRSVALRALGRQLEAHQLAIWCHSNLPPDLYRPELNLVLALGELESGTLDRAHLYYRVVDDSKLESHYQSLYPFVGAWLFGLSGRVEEAAKKLTEATEKLPRSRWDQQQKLVTQMILRALENASTVSPAFQDYREKLQQRWA